jgi:hypothetical protein
MPPQVITVEAQAKFYRFCNTHTEGIPKQHDTVPAYNIVCSILHEYVSDKSNKGGKSEGHKVRGNHDIPFHVLSRFSTSVSRIFHVRYFSIFCFLFYFVMCVFVFACVHFCLLFLLLLNEGDWLLSFC